MRDAARGAHQGHDAAAGRGATPRPGGPAPAVSPPAEPPPAAFEVAPPLPPDDTPLSGPRPTRGVAVSREVREL